MMFVICISFSCNSYILELYHYLLRLGKYCKLLVFLASYYEWSQIDHTWSFIWIDIDYVFQLVISKKSYIILHHGHIGCSCHGDGSRSPEKFQKINEEYKLSYIWILLLRVTFWYIPCLRGNYIFSEVISDEL